MTTNPKLELEFSSTTNEFTVRLLHTKSLEFTIEYQHDGGKNDALTGKATPTTDSYVKTVLAGTESNGAKTNHKVESGTLTVKAKGKDDKTTVFTQGFVIANGKLKITTQEQRSATGGDVLGAQTTEDATGSTARLAPGQINNQAAASPRPTAITTEPEPAADATTSSTMSRSIMIGGGILGLLIIGILIAWMLSKSNSGLQQPTA